MVKVGIYMDRYGYLRNIYIYIYINMCVYIYICVGGDGV